MNIIEEERECAVGTLATMLELVPVTPGDIWFFSKNPVNEEPFKWHTFGDKSEFVETLETDLSHYAWLVPDGVYHMQVFYPRYAQASIEREDTEWVLA